MMADGSIPDVSYNFPRVLPFSVEQMSIETYSPELAAKVYKFFE
jgi:hypothetical protein